MPKQREDRIGLLVIRRSWRRAGAAGSRNLLEVNPPSPDRVIGIVNSSAAASRLVGEWLDSLETDTTAAGSAPQQSVEGDR